MAFKHRFSYADSGAITEKDAFRLTWVAPAIMQGQAADGKMRMRGYCKLGFLRAFNLGSSALLQAQSHGVD